MAVDPNFVLVRRTQLTAVLQCRFIAEGMSDEEALVAAREAATCMELSAVNPWLRLPRKAFK